ncbi:MAG: SDR family oxidoreductase [Candidatus Kerfeldbacteria bacterium]|nr:SDR family oxidoreductase [Candidatus Kerfeldbacteria bacterium]
MRLKKKVVVITGGSKGLGKALASEFVKEGSVVVISARNRKELWNTARECRAIPFVADITKEQNIMSLAKFVKKRLGRIDVWVNNAGVTIPHSDIDGITSEAAHNVMEVNFFGTFYGLQAVIPIMKKQHHGTIVNIISMSALVGRPRSLMYSSSKWAARGLTEGIRMALKPKRISIIAVHPGGMKTTIFGKHLPQGYDDWMEPDFVAKKIIQNLKRAKPREEIVIHR